MKRSLIASAVLAMLLLALSPALAATQVIQLGATRTPLVAPVCPKGVSAANCTIILTQVTALETIRDGVLYPTTVTKAGRIVAFTVGLSRLDPNRVTARQDIHFLDHAYGGTTRAAVTVLSPGRQNRWTVVAESPMIHLQPYLGQVVQISLNRSLPVLPGEVVALTVPTWAPVLSIQVAAKKFSYRQSRTSKCSNPPATQQAQLTLRQSARYLCAYPGTRVEYSATEVTNPVPVNPIHARDTGL